MQQNKNFDNQRNTVFDCSQIGSIDFSPWGKNGGGGNGGANDGDNVDHAEVACKLTDKKAKVMVCGGRGNSWNNRDLEALLEWMDRHGGVSLHLTHRRVA